MAEQTFDSKFKTAGSWALGCRLVGAAAAIGVNVILTRLMTGENTGLYFLAISACWVTSLLMAWGFGQSLVRLIVEHRVSNKESLAPAISGGLIILISLFLIVFVLSQFPIVRQFDRILFQGEFSQLSISLFIFWSLLQALQSFLVEGLRGYEKIISASIFSMLPNLLFLLACLAIYICGSGATPTQLIFTQSLIVSITILVLLCLNKKLFFPLKFIDFGELKKIIRFSFPFLITTVVIYFSTQADLWIAGMYLPHVEVATYGLALRITLLLPFILGVVNSAILPQITEYYAHGELYELEIKLRQTATLAFLPALCIFIFILLGGDRIFSIMFGQLFSESHLIFSILGFGYLIHVWVGSPGYVLLLTKHQILFLVIVASSTALSIVLAMLLVKEYGLHGIAISSSVGISLQSLCSWLFVKYKLGIWTHATSNLKSSMAVIK